MLDRRDSRSPQRARRRGVAAVAAAGALLIAACGPPPTIQGAGEVATADNLPDCPLSALDTADGRVNVVVWHALGAESLQALKAITKRYNASQDKVRVTLQNQGTDYEEVLRKYTSAAQSNKAPDIVYLEDTTISTVRDTGTLFPAQACWKEFGFDPGRLETAARNYYTFDGAFYPGYVNVSTPVLFYNRSHFRRAGLDVNNPPKTLDEVRTAAEKLKAAGIELPLALKLDSWFFTCWVNGAGQDIVVPDNGRAGKVTGANLDTPEGERILEWLRGMVADGLADPISDTPGQINQYLDVAQQRSSMLFETSTAATSIKAFLGGDLDTGGQDTSGVSTTGLDPAAAPFPGLTEPGKVRVSGGYFAVSNQSPDAEQAGALEFLDFMSQPAQVATWHVTGSYLPVLGGAAETQKVQKFWADDIAGQMLKVSYEQLSSIDPDRPGPAMGPYPEYATAMSDAMDRAARGRSSPADALTGANDTLDAALQQYYE